MARTSSGRVPEGTARCVVFILAGVMLLLLGIVALGLICSGRAEGVSGRTLLFPVMGAAGGLAFLGVGWTGLREAHARVMENDLRRKRRLKMVRAARKRMV